MIKNFTDAFEYVNSKYLFTEENYPVIARLTQEQAKIFPLNHGLLHVLKSAHKIKGDAPYEKEGIRQLQWITQSNEKLGANALTQKIGTLKMLVNILSLVHAVGITKEQVAALQIPTDSEMIVLIPIKQMKKAITPTFTDTIEYLIENLATFLEKADHENTMDWTAVADLVNRVFLATIYWFDDFWVPAFLQQIPSVMKSS